MEAIKTGKFLSAEGKAQEAKFQHRAETKEQREKAARRRNRLLINIGLALGVGLLVHMVLNSLIDQTYGILFIAGVSALFGYNITIAPARRASAAV